MFLFNLALSCITSNDTLKGVCIGNDELFRIQGDSPQFFNWEQYGLRITVPQGTLSPTDTCEVSVAALIGGQFHLPEKTELISAVYNITVSKPLLKSIKLEIQHCARLITRDHTSYLSFATASIQQSTTLPYEFQLQEGGQFYPGDQYGSINLSHFCLKAIVKFRTDPFRSDNVLAQEIHPFVQSIDLIGGSKLDKVTNYGKHSVNDASAPSTSDLSYESNNEVHHITSFECRQDNSTITLEHEEAVEVVHTLDPTTSNEAQIKQTKDISPDNDYFGQMVYERCKSNEWLTHFIVAKHLNVLTEYIKNSLPKSTKKDVYLSFTFQDRNGFIVLALNEEQQYSFNGWGIISHRNPPRIHKSEVDKYGAENPPSVPSILITITADDRPDTVTQLKYRVPLKGVIPDDMELYLIRSLGDVSTTILVASENISTPKDIGTKPKKHVLLTLLSPIYHLWRELGDLLGVDSGKINSLSISLHTDLAKMSDVLQSWLDSEPTPVTWNNIINMIEGPLQNKTLADEICQKVISSSTF